MQWCQLKSLWIREKMWSKVKSAVQGHPLRKWMNNESNSFTSVSRLHKHMHARTHTVYFYSLLSLQQLLFIHSCSHRQEPAFREEKLEPDRTMHEMCRVNLGIYNGDFLRALKIQSLCVNVAATQKSLILYPQSEISRCMKKLRIS